MKFEISRLTLLNALQSIIGVVERRQTMPVLANFLLQLENGQLRITGTDLELELVVSVDLKSGDEGICTAPARKLFDICRGMSENAILTIEYVDQKLTVRTDRSRFSLATLPAEEFPVVEDLGEGETLNIPKQSLKRVIQRTHFAMAHQDVRYYLNGLLLSISGARLRAVATDGHRLALCDVDYPSEKKQEKQVILPRKAIMELQRLLDDAEDTVAVRLTDNHVRMDVDKLRFTSKLIDGHFPDYERVIPPQGDKRLVADRNMMRSALYRAAILSNEKFHGVRVQMSADDLKLQAHNPEHEEAEEQLEGQYEGDPLEIGFNVTYLLDALSAMESEQFELSMTDADHSGLLMEVGNSDSRYVVMPMRL